MFLSPVIFFYKKYVEFDRPGEGSPGQDCCC